MGIPLVDATRAMLAIARARKGQGSIEYIMMLSAVSIIIVVALAMMTQLKGAALGSFFNGSSGGISSQLASKLGNLTKLT